jgi:polyribonucleotide nucleotidyltransferase
MIKEIVAEPEVGEIYQGTVVGLKDFGAFVNFFGPKDGLVHVSQMANERVAIRKTWSRKATRSGSSCSASTTAAKSACR